VQIIDDSAIGKADDVDFGRIVHRWAACAGTAELLVLSESLGTGLAAYVKGDGRLSVFALRVRDWVVACLVHGDKLDVSWAREGTLPDLVAELGREFGDGELVGFGREEGFIGSLDGIGHLGFVECTSVCGRFFVHCGSSSGRCEVARLMVGGYSISRGAM